MQAHIGYIVTQCAEGCSLRRLLKLGNYSTNCFPKIINVSIMALLYIYIGKHLCMSIYYENTMAVGMAGWEINERLR